MKIVRGPPLHHIPPLSYIQPQKAHQGTSQNFKGSSQDFDGSHKNFDTPLEESAQSFESASQNYEGLAKHSQPKPLEQVPVDVVDLDNPDLEQVSIVEGFGDGNDEDLFPGDIGMIDS